MNQIGARIIAGELARLVGSSLLVTGGLAVYLCYGYAVGQGPDLDAGMLCGWLKGLAAAAVFVGADWPIVWLPASIIYGAWALWRFVIFMKHKRQT